jgi:hypothetical protein
MAATEIGSVHDLLEAIRESKIANKDHAHIRLWFRGQSNSGWPLYPGVYRPTFPETDEAKRLRVERHMANDFRVQSAGLLTEARDNARLYFLQQHYKVPTRLLDWTNSPLAALHFAAADDTNDGVLFILDAYRLAPTQAVPEEEFRGIATSRNELFVKALHVIFDWWKETNFPGFIMPVRPDHFDTRIMLQKGCFTFHPPGKGELKIAESGVMFKHIVPKKAKPNIKSELFLLGVDAFAIYGDLDSLATRLKFAHRVREKM